MNERRQRRGDLIGVVQPRCTAALDHAQLDVDHGIGHPLADGRGELAEGWTVDDAAATLDALAHFDTWRELVIGLGWSHDHDVESMTRLLARALLVS